MRNSESEVFANFVKIAKEKGLVPEKEQEHTEKNTKNPRWDSLDISAIEALYGVKPDLPKGMEYEHNIMEDAHPNSVVVSPAYDRLNGLVENNIERQNILMHILYKQPEIGTLNQFRYPQKPKLLWQTADPTKLAQKDLMLALVRIGNDMDNQDRNELRILADTCLGQIHKEAVGPLANTLSLISLISRKTPLIGLSAAALGVLLGGIYLQQHMSNLDRGLTENYNRLQESLDTFMNSSIGFGLGHEYDATLKEHVSGLKSRLTKFWDTYQKVSPLIRAMEKPKDHVEAIKMAQDPKIMSIAEARKELLAETYDLNAYLDKINEEFQNIDYKAEHTQKGGIISALDSIPFFHGSGKGSLIADDFGRAVNAIGPFRAGVARLLKSLNDSETVGKQWEKEYANSVSKTQSEIGSTTKGDAEVEAEKKQHAELGQDLGGYANQPAT